LRCYPLLLPVLGPAQMLGAVAPLTELIAPIFAVRTMAHKNGDNGRAGFNPPLPRVHFNLGFFRVREVWDVHAGHGSTELAQNQ